MKPTRYILLCVLMSLASEGTWAQRQPPQPTTIVLKLSPMAPDRPAMRNRLLPFVGDQIPGNAAQLYLMAMLGLWNSDADFDKASQLLESPLEKMNRDEAAALIRKYRFVLPQIEQATLRESCEWGNSIRQEGIRALLPHLNDIRFLSMLIALQVRVDLAAGQYDKAIHWLRVGCTMVRHLNSQAVLTQGLVAAGVAGQMTKVMLEFVQGPGAPNMYWPLVNLPQPMLDLGKMLEWERAGIYFTCPALKDVRTTALTAQQWQNLVDDMRLLGASNMMLGSADDPLMRQLSGPLLGLRAFPAAREHLLRLGYTREQLDAMPVPQILGIYYVDSYESWCDEMFKWAAVPYWRLCPSLSKLEKEFIRERDIVNPFLDFLPAVSANSYKLAAMERDFAALRTIEAIRAYAATHDGRLPRSLDDMLDPAESLDPLTGKPFEWKSDGGTGVLTTPTVPDDWHRGFRYEITLRK